MFVVGNFVGAVAQILDLILWAYMWLLIIRALLSWVSPDPRNSVVQFLVRVTEPVLGPIRNRLPTWRMGIDLSPVVAILAIYFVQWFLVATLKEMAWRMR